MANPNSQSEFIIVKHNYISLLEAQHLAELKSERHYAGLKAAELQGQLSKELAERDKSLIHAKEEAANLNQALLAWRMKAKLYKAQYVALQECGQLTESNLTISERLANGLKKENDVLIETIKALQEHVDSLTSLVQENHLEKVQQQGQFAHTNTEVQKLQSLSELLNKQLTNERAAFEVAREQAESLREQLTKAESQLQAVSSASAALQTECDRLQGQLFEEREARAASEAHALKLSKDLELRSEELSLSEQRFTEVSNDLELRNEGLAVSEQRFANVSKDLELRNEELAASEQRLAKVSKDLELRNEELAASEQRFAKVSKDLELRSEELAASEQRLVKLKHATAQRELDQAEAARRLKVSDDATIQDIQRRAEQLKERLEQERRDAVEELRTYRAKLEREVELRKSVEDECAQHHQRLQEKQASYDASIAQLRRERSFIETELEQLQRKVAASEKQAAAHIAELHASLERSAQKLCQQVTGKDAALDVMQEQLEQRRKQIEQKEEELRDVRDAHARQVQLLEQRLIGQHEAAREKEAVYREQAELAKQQVATMSANETQTKLRMLELQSMLETRDERIRQLQEARSKDMAQYDERLRQLQHGQEVEASRLRSRIRELEQQLTMPSPMEPLRYQVMNANAAVEKLVGNLTCGSLGLVSDSVGHTDDDDEGRALTAQFLGMSQRTIFPFLGASQPPSWPAGAEVQSSQPAAAAAAEAPATAPAPCEAVAPCSDSLAHASGKRVQEQPADAEGDGLPGRGGRRKAAKGATGERIAAGTGAAEPCAAAATGAADTNVDADGRQAPQYEGRTTRRRAAQSGMARVKAMAETLAGVTDDEVTEDTTTSYNARGNTRSRRRPQTTRPPKIQEVDEGAVEATVQAPAATRRGRAGRGTKAGQGQDADARKQGKETVVKPEAKVVAEPIPGALPARGPQHAAAAADRTAAQNDKVPAPRPAEKEIFLSQLPTEDIQPQLLSQPHPPGQPQLSSNLIQRDLVTTVGGIAVPRVLTTQQAAACSQVSIFSQTFKPFEPSLAKNPLAALNPKLVEQVKNRARPTPLTVIHQTKPSLQKPTAATKRGELSRSILPGPGPSGATGVADDMLTKSLQQAGKVGR